MISLKIPKDQLKEIDRRAKNLHMNRSEYVRFVALNTKIRVEL
jgi:metal-responsive CopG/Arc/MetJ family transcriptional regulator